MEQNKKETIKGANPYMPLWEHVPDGEPRVFEYKGEKRVYVYGSHDTAKTAYCGQDYVVWSAPVNDLTNWRYDGVCYKSNSFLYAPDVVQKGDTFYMYAAEQAGSKIVVVSSKNPAGPFENRVETKLGFDPGVLVDEDGRVYAYWGFQRSYCAELESDMATIKAGTIHEDTLTHSKNLNGNIDGHEGNDYFFEASSPRKIMGKYVYLYSKRYDVPVKELGSPAGCNGFLSYKISNKPLDGFTDGGDISFNGGEILHLDEDKSKGTMSYRWGNNHGGLVEIEGQWYIFYHRQTGVNEYSRQGMMEPVDIAKDKNGKLFIGKIDYENDEPVKSSPVEMTSQGPHVNGLDAFKWISAGYACHIFGGKAGGANGGQGQAYIKPVYEQKEDITSPVVDITSGVTVGFRYLQFSEKSPNSVIMEIEALKNIKVNVRIDDFKGECIASAELKSGEKEVQVTLSSEVTGKHAIYFEFICEADKNSSIANFLRFSFI